MNTAAEASGIFSNSQVSDLQQRISERIRSRLGQRIYDLSVSVNAKTVEIKGRCATYYTKQLAQHAALGVLEDENLRNAIEVNPTALAS